jgi:hypothetical protein
MQTYENLSLVALTISDIRHCFPSASFLETVNMFKHALGLRVWGISTSQGPYRGQTSNVRVETRILVLCLMRFRTPEPAHETNITKVESYILYVEFPLHQLKRLYYP